MQKILVLETETPDLDAGINGLSPDATASYRSPKEAITAGWKLICSPQPKTGDEHETYYEWWLTRKDIYVKTPVDAKTRLISIDLKEAVCELASECDFWQAPYLVRCNDELFTSYPHHRPDAPGKISFKKDGVTILLEEVDELFQIQVNL